MRSSTIIGVEYSLGSQTLSYEELEERFGVATIANVFSGSGIRNRRVAPPGVCGSDLAFEAAEQLIERLEIDRQGVDLLIHCTQSPDYILPTTACVLQNRLRLSKRCASFDINLGCSQYVYALSIAHSMIAAGLVNRALVLTGDTMTHTLHPKDRALIPLLGDAGSATLVEPCETGTGFLGFEFGTDGAGAEYLMIPAGGFRRPGSAETAVEYTDPDGCTRTPDHMRMDGSAVFYFAISVVPKTVASLLAKLNLTVDQVDCFLFHQANKYMLDYLVKKMRIPVEKTHFFVEDIGNSSGSTMPTVLTEAIRVGKVKPGSLVVMIVFGVGLSWAATALRWS